jgi:hypothetical protein
MQAFHLHKILIKEQQVNDINPLYELAYMSRDLLRFPNSVSLCTVHCTYTTKGKSN